SSDRIQQPGHPPGADGHVGGHRVQRMPQIDAAQQIAHDPRADDTGDAPGHRPGDLVQRLEPLEPADDLAECAHVGHLSAGWSSLVWPGAGSASTLTAPTTRT